MKINKNDIIADVLEKYPDSIDLFLEFGLHCIACHGATYESIEDGCIKHGMSFEIIEELIEELNQLCVTSNEK